MEMLARIIENSTRRRTEPVATFLTRFGIKKIDCKSPTGRTDQRGCKTAGF
jgi:hypothetical protein